MKKLLISISFLSIINLLMAQTGSVGIGTTSPDPAAALDISSSDKGILIPRTTKIAVQAAVGSGSIPDGLLIYDINDNSFYYRVNNEWKKLGVQSELIDADGDTRVFLEESLQDAINFQLDNTEHVAMRKNTDGTFRIDLPNNSGNTAIGENVFSLNQTGTDNIALGKEAMRNSTDAQSNVAIGVGALYSNNGVDNISIGRNNNQANIDGNENVSVGSAALLNNVEGSGNVALGHGAGFPELGSNKLYIENSTADSTGALIYGEFDKDSLRFNATVNINGNYILPTTGGTESQVMSLNNDGQAVWDSLILMDQDSTNELIQAAVGGYNQIWITEGTAGHIIDLHVGQVRDSDEDTGLYVDKDDIDDDKIRFDIDGTENLVIRKNDGGVLMMEIKNNSDNVFIGENAGLNATGLDNTFIGDFAGRDNVNGYWNTYIGSRSGASNTTGDQNTYVGEVSGEEANGSRNTYLGIGSGRNIQGDRNVAIGNDAGNSASGDKNVFIGNEAGYHSQGNNKLYIENTNADSTAALIYGEFDNDKLSLNAEVNINGDYTLPTDTASANQYMIMGADGKLKWHSEQVGYGAVTADWGFISTSKEIYDGLDTTFFSFGYGIQTPMIVDEDGDTKIEVQDLFGADDDIIRFNIDGTEKLVLGNNASGDLMMEILDNSSNIFIGEDAGENTITSANVFIGNNSGKDNTSGGKNTFIGKGSGRLNTSGTWNTFIGVDAGFSNTSGDQNTYVGEVSGESANGDRNTYLGIGSGRNIQGDRNVAIGNDAGNSASGDKNVFIGNNAGYYSQGNDKLYIENTNADSTAALIYGEFDNDKLWLNAEVNIDGKYTLPTTYGAPHQFMRVDNTGQVAWDDFSPGITDVSFSNGTLTVTEEIYSNGIVSSYITPTAIVTSLIEDGDGDTKIQVEESNDDDIIRFDVNGQETLTLNQQGLGIGTQGQYPLHINASTSKIKLANTSNQGATTRTANNVWQVRLSDDLNEENLGIYMNATQFEPYDSDTLTLGSSSYKWKEIYATNATINTSDRRFKKNINDLGYGLETVMQMRPVSYQWKKETNGRTINGFIAQEMEEIVPEVVEVSQVSPNPDKPGTESEYSELYGMRYTELIPVLTKAIQDQQAIIEVLTQRVEALEKK